MKPMYRPFLNLSEVDLLMPTRQQHTTKKSKMNPMKKPKKRSAIEPSWGPSAYCDPALPPIYLSRTNNERLEPKEYLDLLAALEFYN